MHPFCIYVTYHSTGKFYVGKAPTERVLSGAYRGSGTILLDTFKKYPKTEWVTDIVETYDTEEAAYRAEAMWVDDDLLADPLCLNINRGGKGGCRRKQSPEEIAKRAASIRKTKASREHREMMSRVSSEASLRPEVQAIRRLKSKELWSTEERRAKMLEAREDSYGDKWKSKLSEKTKIARRRPFSVEVNGVVYPRQVDACKALNLHRKLLRKLPSFREIH